MVDALLAYNTRVAAASRFVGMSADNEPHQDLEPPWQNSFHKGKADSALSTLGGGVWYPTEAQDRDTLMQDWIGTFEESRRRLRAAGLRLNAALPYWWVIGEVDWAGTGRGVGGGR